MRALDLKDVGRCEFRVSPSSTKGYEVHFLEVDALPTLDPGGGIAMAARARGTDYDGLVRAIVKSACKRQRVTLEPSPKRPKRSSLRVGLAFNMKRISTDASDAEA